MYTFQNLNDSTTSLKSFSSPIASGSGSSMPLRATPPNNFSKAFIVTTAIVIGFVAQNVADVACLTKLPFGKIPSLAITNASPWIPSEVLSWLNSNASNTAVDMDNLKLLIASVFGDVPVSTEVYHDPDESWSKVLVRINSNLGDDFDKQIRLENQLFANIWKSLPLRSLTHSLIITQS